MFDGKEFGREIVDVVKSHMDRSLAPILARMDAIEGKLALPPVVDADDLQFVKSEMETLRSAIAGIQPQEAKGGDQFVSAWILEEKIAAAVAAIPLPKDGIPGERGIDGAPGKDGVDGKDGQPGKDGINGKDGLDAVEFVRGASGNLLVSMSNGTVRDLGEFIGKDGAPGKDGEAGRDGFGFDDLDVVETEKGWMIRFKRADKLEEFRLPIPFDCGVYKDGQSYFRGASVSFGGSMFIAQEDTTEKPETGKAWRLAVTHGRHGKDGEMKPAREPKPVKVG